MLDAGIQLYDQHSSDAFQFVPGSTPIAVGFSAFLINGSPGVTSLHEFLIGRNSVPNVNYIEIYFDLCRKQHWEKHEQDLKFNFHQDVFWAEFLVSHFNEELRNYQNSELLFNEILNDKDKQIKVNLNAYAVKYIQFLQEKMGPITTNEDSEEKVSLIASFNLKNSNSILGKNSETNKITKQKINTLTFKDIWIGTSTQYNSVEKILTTINLDISDVALVKQVDGKLFWHYPAKYGRDKYLRGFLYTCLTNNLISNQVANVFAKILSNTFNIDCKHDAFKSISGNPPDEKYLIPFISFPSNS